MKRMTETTTTTTIRYITKWEYCLSAATEFVECQQQQQTNMISGETRIPLFAMIMLTEKSFGQTLVPEVVTHFPADVVCKLIGAQRQVFCHWAPQIVVRLQLICIREKGSHGEHPLHGRDNGWQQPQTYEINIAKHLSFVCVLTNLMQCRATGEKRGGRKVNLNKQKDWVTQLP